jgi:hypothetical protein
MRDARDGALDGGLIKDDYVLVHRSHAKKKPSPGGSLFAQPSKEPLRLSICSTLTDFAEPI